MLSSSFPSSSSSPPSFTDLALYLHLAASKGDIASAQALIDTATQLNCKSQLIEVSDQQGFTPLIAASRGGYLDFVNFLLSHGARVDAHTKNLNNSLLYACLTGNLALVRRLVDSGTSIHWKNLAGDSCLLWSCMANQLEICHYLLSEGANSAEQNYEQLTPLQCSAMQGNTQILKLLLSLSQSLLSLNIQNSSGDSALHLACEGNFFDCVEILLVYKANPWIKNNKGKFPHQLTKDQEIKKLLMKIQHLNENQEKKEIEENSMKSAEFVVDPSIQALLSSSSSPASFTSNLSSIAADIIYQDLIANELKEKKQLKMKERIKQMKKRRKGRKEKGKNYQEEDNKKKEENSGEETKTEEEEEEDGDRDRDGDGDGNEDGEGMEKEKEIIDQTDDEEEIRIEQVQENQILNNPEEKEIKDGKWEIQGAKKNKSKVQEKSVVQEQTSGTTPKNKENVVVQVTSAWKGGQWKPIAEQVKNPIQTIPLVKSPSAVERKEILRSNVQSSDFPPLYSSSSLSLSSSSSASDPFDSLSSLLDSLHPRASDLALHPLHLFGQQFDDLSFSQLNALEEIFQRHLQRVQEAKLRHLMEQNREMSEEMVRIKANMHSLQGELNAIKAAQKGN
jgi:ankyrin repeat protein